MELFCGLRVIITDKICKQVRAKKHKKRRIDKKWLKKYGFVDVPDNNKMLHIDNSLYMTQRCYDKVVTLLDASTRQESESAGF